MIYKYVNINIVLEYIRDGRYVFVNCGTIVTTLDMEAAGYTCMIHVLSKKYHDNRSKVKVTEIVKNIFQIGLFDFMTVFDVMAYLSLFDVVTCF